MRKEMLHTLQIVSGTESSSFSTRTCQLLQQIAAGVDGDELARQLAEAIQDECELVRIRTIEQHVKPLQERLGDACTLFAIQERQLVGRKGSRLRQVCDENAQFRQRCEDLEAALIRQPEDEAKERDQLIGEILSGGERIDYLALFCVENDLQLVEQGWASYLTFVSSTSNLEKLQMARQAITLIEQAQTGRKTLARLSSADVKGKG